MVVDIIEDTADALKAIEDAGIPVFQGWYDEDIKKTHITLWNLGENEQDHADDSAESERHSVQVTIFSKKDEVELAQKIRTLLQKNDFVFEGRNADESDPQDGIYMKAQRFSKVYEREE